MWCRGEGGEDEISRLDAELKDGELLSQVSNPSTAPLKKM
jgi:hypothetical protein